MADKGPFGNNPWKPGRKVAANPELCRPGKMPSGNRELNRGSGMPPANPELCRPGVIPATMPEIDRGKFSGGSLVDRTSQNEAMGESCYDSTSNFIPGHKIMAGMP